MIDIVTETLNLDETYYYDFVADLTSGTDNLSVTYTPVLVDIAVLEDTFDSDNIVNEILD